MPIGFLTVGLSALSPGFFPATAALHAWTAGAIALMTLSLMTRATLGHTRRALSASGPTIAIYLAALIAALARLAAAVLPALAMPLLDLAGLAWIGCFIGYVAVHGPMLVGPRRI